MRVAVVAPGGRFVAAAEAPAVAQAAALGVELYVHPQCHLASGHFSGTDAERLAAFVQVSNDPGFDAVWFARGGYGSCRIAGEAIAALSPAARDKTYMGYSDAGYLLAGLYRAGFPHLAHGPMVEEVLRPAGEEAIARSISWLSRRDPAGLEPGLRRGDRHAAFNLTVLGLLLGTPLEPDVAGHVLLLEDVGEEDYRSDRALFHLTAQPAMRRLAGIRMGRFSAVPPNHPEFGAGADDMARHWCARSGIPFLGAADIGHDAGNKIVPFGVL